MPNKRKICAENLNSSQNIYIPSLNSYYPPESVINSAYRKVLDFKENAEKILEKEKLETLSLNDFSKAILESRSFEISLQHNCIKLKCYITLEKDKDAKKKRNEGLSPNGPITPPATPDSYHARHDSISSCNTPSVSNLNDDLLSPTFSKSASGAANSGGAKKVNVEVIMKSNPFRVEENEKTTRMELVRTNYNETNGMLRFTYYVRPECEAKKFRDNNTEMFDKGRLIVFTNDFFTVYQDSATGEMNISLNEIVQTQEEQMRTEALGEKLFTLLKDRPRHRALLTNECKLNHTNSLSANTHLSSSSPTLSTSFSYSDFSSANNEIHQNQHQQQQLNNQEDETYYTRELIQIYGQPIVPSFHKYFNYQLSNTHYGYRTLRRLLNCDILKKYVKITKEEIKSLDRVVEFVQLTSDKCLSAFQLNLTSFYEPERFLNGIVKDWLDVWYVNCLKEKYSFNESAINKEFIGSPNPSTPMLLSSSSTSSLSTNTFSFPLISSSSSSWSLSSTKSTNCFLQTTNGDHEDTECDQANHLWFCLKDYLCSKMEEFIRKIDDYIEIKNNQSELILVHSAYPKFNYRDVLSESRRILALFLNKSSNNKTIDEIIRINNVVAKEHVKNLLVKFLNLNEENKVVGFTALFEILMILKRELVKEKNDEMKYSHFLCTLERANQEKLKMAIVQLKCVPCLNKFTTNFNLINSSAATSSSMTNSSKSIVSHANMNRLLKQMSLIVSTELQQIAIDLYEKMDEDKPVKFIRLKDEFKHSNNMQQQNVQQSPQQQQQTNLQQANQTPTYSSVSRLIPSTQQQSKSKITETQITNLANSISKKIDLSSNQTQINNNNNNSKSSTNTTGFFNTSSTNSSNRILPISNPNKFLNQFKAEEKKLPNANTTNSIDAYNNLYYYRC